MDVSDAIRVIETEAAGKNPDEIVRDGRNVYLRIPLDPGFEAGFAFRMITSVQPSCLLPVGIVREGHAVLADYRISGWTALSSVPGEDLPGLLYGLISALKSAADELAECLLSADDLSLDPHRIFLKRETGEIRFCYLLEDAIPFGESLQELMEFFIRTAKPSGEQEVLLLYGLYQKSREENVTPEVLTAFRSDLLNSGNAPRAEVKAAYTLDTAEDESREIYERLGLNTEEIPVRQIDDLDESKYEKAERKHASPKKTSGTNRAPQPKTSASEPAARTKTAGTENVPAEEEQGKSRSFVRKHLPEILIGAAAVILAICALVL